MIDVKRAASYLRIAYAESADVKLRFLEIADLLESLSAELEQVKNERDGLNVLLAQAQSMLETRTRERDAAVKDIPRACGYCKHYLGDKSFVNCNHECMNISGMNTGWQWRGVQEET